MAEDREMLCLRPELEGLSQLSITFGIMGKMIGLIFCTYYHDERIAGGKNIFYYDINPGVKTF